MIPIMLLTLAYIIGIIVGLYNYCIVLFCLFLCYLFKKENIKLILFIILFFTFSVILTVYRVNNFDKKYFNGNIEMKVKVVSDVIEKNNSNSYIVKNDLGEKFILYTNKNIILEHGMKISFNGELQLPDTSRNRRRI